MLNRLLNSTGPSALLLLLALAVPTAPCAAQSLPRPEREQLLNGLTVLLLPRPGDANVLLKLRINSGAAFDLAGKEGMMALLGDALFPDQTTHQYVTNELGGRLEVTTDYDSINVTLAGPVADYERLVELLRNAVVTTPLTAEVIGQLREARIKTTRETGIAPATIADRAIAARLFGSYPYGRPPAGTPETLARIERRDLLTARERFLNPNNSTLVVIGGVDKSRATRALRQLLGQWQKSEGVVPATFQRPLPPDPRTLIVNVPGMQGTEIRLATRAPARSAPDYEAVQLLALVARDRWQKSFSELKDHPFFVRADGYFLSGVFEMGAAVPTTMAAQALDAARGVLNSLATTQPSADEIQSVKRDALATLNKAAGQADWLANAWLDEATYGIAPAEEERAMGALTPVDLQRVAAKLFRNAPIASVAVGDAAQLRPILERSGAVEVLGAESPKNAPRPPVKRP